MTSAFFRLTPETCFVMAGLAPWASVPHVLNVPAPSSLTLHCLFSSLGYSGVYDKYPPEIPSLLFNQSNPTHPGGLSQIIPHVWNLSSGCPLWLWFPLWNAITALNRLSCYPLEDWDDVSITRSVTARTMWVFTFSWIPNSYSAHFFQRKIGIYGLIW